MAPAYYREANFSLFILKYPRLVKKMLAFHPPRARSGRKSSRLPAFLSYLLLAASAFTPSHSFTFRFTSPPTQCATTRAIWGQGEGTPPYKLLLLPIGFMPEGVERRVIFERTVESEGELEFVFPFPADSRFVAVMSDATGFGTGGTSPILTVRSSNSSSCLPSTPSQPQFYLYLSPITPTQCSRISISWDTPRNPPATVYGVIPQGQSFDLNALSRSNGGLGFEWTCNVRSGTPFFFVAGDGNGSGTGGSTDVVNIASGGSACISDRSPSSTPDAGVGSVGPLPNGGTGGGGGTITGTGTAVVSATNFPGGGGGAGDTNGGGSPGGGGDTNGTGGGGTGPGETNGSGGGTVHGPLDPTSIAGAANTNTRGLNISLILGLVLGLIALAVLLTLFIMYSKRRKTALARRDNQRTRLLAAGDFSQTHLPQTDDPYGSGLGGLGGRWGGGSRRAKAAPPITLPHPHPAFATRAWAGASLESLTSNLRFTPFIWPLGSGSNANSPAERRNAGTSPVEWRTPLTPRTPQDRHMDVHNDSRGGAAAFGATTARPALETGVTGSSSGMLRRLRSVRHAGGVGSGFSFSFPFGGGGGEGYLSLGDGEGDENIPSSRLRNTMTSNSGSALGAGHGATPSGDDSSASEMHKSPLPTSYTAQHAQAHHVSQNSHVSNNSRFSCQPGHSSQHGDITPPPIPMSNLGANDSVTRPGSSPAGPRRPLGQRPSLGREDTGGSVWEVPPTYASLQGRRQVG